MLAPNSDLAILLKAMGSFQDWVNEEHPERKGHPTMVHHDWDYHKRETGSDQSKIGRLLPQLVSTGLVFDVASHSPRGGNPTGMKPADGWAWISDTGQFELFQMKQPPPAIQIMISELGPVAEFQFTQLLRQAADAGITRDDIRRVEDLL